MADKRHHCCPPRAGLRKRVFTKLYNKAMAKYEPYIADRKQVLFANLPDRVVEIGPGTGANLAYLPSGCRFIGIEPNPFMHDLLKQRGLELGVDTEFRLAMAEKLEFDDDSIEAVIGTLVLCSVAEPAQLLAEIRRILKPGGKFFFIEHVAAPEKSWLRFLQRVLRPIWKFVGDGCHPDRDTAQTIEAAGFTSLEIEEFTVPRGVLPRFVSPHIAGVATR